MNTPSVIRIQDVPVMIDQNPHLQETSAAGTIRTTARVPLPTRVPAVKARQVADDLGLMTARDVVRTAGISYRMLDHWTTRGRLVPAIHATGSGTSRLYWPEVVDEIRDMMQRMEACPYHPHQGPAHDVRFK